MNLNKNWQIIITNLASKSLRKIPQFHQIERVINQMEINPFVGDIKKLKGIENVWRRRIGNYRIIFEIFSQEKIIYIYDIQRRGSKSY